MLKLLLRLWADQKRRDFKWMRFLGEAYLFLLFLIISASVTFVAYTEMGATSGAAVAVPFVAAGLIVPDFLPQGLFDVTVFADGATPKEIVVTHRIVSARDLLRMHCLPRGGFLLSFVRE